MRTKASRSVDTRTARALTRIPELTSALLDDPNLIILPTQTAVTGSRSIDDYDLVAYILDEYHADFPFSVQLNGKSPYGVDRLAEEWAEKNNIPIDPFPAQWETYGRQRAGRIRNADMVHHSKRVIAIWDGESGGTADAIGCGQRFEKPTTVYTVDSDRGLIKNIKRYNYNHLKWSNPRHE